MLSIEHPLRNVAQSGALSRYWAAAFDVLCYLLLQPRQPIIGIKVTLEKQLPISIFSSISMFTPLFL